MPTITKPGVSSDISPYLVTGRYVPGYIRPQCVHPPLGSSRLHPLGHDRPRYGCASAGPTHYSGGRVGALVSVCEVAGNLHTCGVVNCLEGDGVVIGIFPHRILLWESKRDNCGAFGGTDGTREALPLVLTPSAIPLGKGDVYT